MENNQEQVELKALEAPYLAYADEFERLERERDHILFEHAEGLDAQKVVELRSTISPSS
jgi:hypothetical protein